jgi:hypothetical protein
VVETVAKPAAKAESAAAPEKKAEAEISTSAAKTGVVEKSVPPSKAPVSLFF